MAIASAPEKPQKPRFSFSRLAERTAVATGRPGAFLGAALLIILWAATGPLFHYNNGWQLVINTGTTILTFLMVFLIQNAQNREMTAVQIKLDELIRAVEGAHNQLLGLEQMDDEALARIRANYLRLADEARKHLERGGADTDVPTVEPCPPEGAQQPPLKN